MRDEILAKITQAQIDRFWARVSPTDENGCRLWTGAIGLKGYGNVVFWKSHENVHRAAYFFATGKWPEDMVLHRCDVRLCCEPTHLFTGTAKVNTQDMVSKGRAGWQRMDWSAITAKGAAKRKKK